MEVKAASMLGTELVSEVFESLPTDSERVGPRAPISVHLDDFVSSTTTGTQGTPGIDTTPVNAVASFEVFMGRRYDPAERDGDSISTEPALRPSRDGDKIATIASFVDAAVHGRKRPPVDAALTPAMETPLRRYQSLVAQLSALERDLATVDATTAARVQPSKDMLRLLANETAALSVRVQQLGGAAAAAELRTSASTSATAAGDVSVYDSLQQLADSLRLPPATSNDAMTVQDDIDAAPTVLLELERRITLLERADTPASTAALPADVIARIAALENDLLARSSAPSTAVDTAAAAHSRLLRSVQLLETWDAQSAAVPWLVSRFASLEPVVRNATLLPARLAALEAAAVQATELLEADRQLLGEVQTGLADMAAALAVRSRE